jgi:CheY-like chemotaxis protein
MINDFVSNGTATILSVDDDPDKSELLSVILKDAGYHVISSSDVRAALELAQRDMPSLIISDVSMPAMDGIEFCRLARADEKLRRVPIMLVTAVRKDTESRGH